MPVDVCFCCGASLPTEARRCLCCGTVVSASRAGASSYHWSEGLSRRTVMKGLLGLAAAGGTLPWLAGCQQPSRAPARSATALPTTSPSPTPTQGPLLYRPIEHIVIIFKENHSFDNYFGRFPGADGDPTLPLAPDQMIHDPPHDHQSWLRRSGYAARLQYSQANLPAYFAYARQYTLCDRYFTDVAGPSVPNHLMLIAADSPIVNNPLPSDPPNMRPPFDLPSLPASLLAAGISWRNYGGFVFDYITSLKDSPNNVPSDQFVTDASAGNLPAVSWVFARTTVNGADAPSEFDEHPPSSVAQGEAWTVAQVNAIVEGGLWPKTAIFITWDDWGGWADHVVPPNVEQWTDGTQFRYGSRVGCLVLSPYARSGYISHMLHSHVSLLAFCETTFSLPPLNARAAAADDMSDCFDFTQKPLPPPVANPGAKATYS